MQINYKRYYPNMVQISAFKIINANKQNIWKIISDVDNDPNYWYGIKKVKNLRKEQDFLERETIIAFRKSTCIETVKFKDNMQIDFKIIKGPIIGTKTLKLSKISDLSCKLEAIWDIKLQGPMSIFTFMVKRHILKGTKEALDRIAQSCEKLEQ
ncbi:SRPBCC family protein [Candidatus Nitrosocosmicus sp. SS]|nr:SRPBCC family protein [Candidatus Nitrosocosmicus sp. SS]